MKSPFINHLITKIIEGKSEVALSSSAAKATLSKLEEVAEAIRTSQGEDAKQSVLSYIEVKRALEQCIDFVDNKSTQVTDEDHTIYYDFIYSNLTKAEAIIDSELTHLGL
ncbi:hypothetical protein K6Y31_10865 [Motilimonas cestriensis]|uniref:Uncharacterized protein n=1 Tax=Motilimonas cestriensis TaxID=2742685 RepID=A0ABS8WCH0_9GAMM|nr:hypothetical protein [Motilimonas cestriensis]MCE2595316.1 hypothetical protein [Motilimonas cestriensis]